VRDDFNVNFAAFAFEQIPDRARNIVAERLEGLALDVRPSTSECSTYQTPASSS
jgi:hypothetical protein